MKKPSGNKEKAVKNLWENNPEGHDIRVFYKNAAYVIHNLIHKTVQDGRNELMRYGGIILSGECDLVSMRDRELLSKYGEVKSVMMTVCEPARIIQANEVRVRDDFVLEHGDLALRFSDNN